MKKQIRIDEFLGVLPYEEVKRILGKVYGKREIKHLEEYMNGQTMQHLSEQAGIYYCDLLRFISLRNKDIKGKNMPLVD